MSDHHATDEGNVHSDFNAPDADIVLVSSE